MLLEQTLLLALSILAYVAQAMTAALAAGRRSMDWMGVCMLGSVAAQRVFRKKWGPVLRSECK